MMRNSSAWRRDTSAKKMFIASVFTVGSTSVSSRPSCGLTAANAYSYSRMNGVLTSGRTPGRHPAASRIADAPETRLVLKHDAHRQARRLLAYLLLDQGGQL